MTTEKIDSIQKALDYAIRDHEYPEVGFGYEIDGRVYNNYASKEAFEIEKGKMNPLIKEQFDCAPGGELKEKRGRDQRLYPPKMACFGSSSRFILSLLKEDKDICFEAALPTHVGNSANLDARKKFKTRSKEVLAEAKCREIYGSHRKVEVNKVYLPLFDELKIFFTYTFEESKERYVKCVFSVDDKEVVHFDLKQLICHLLGIASAVIEGEIKAKTIHFVYVIYNPKNIKICDKYRNKILAQYKKCIEEIDQFDMEALFAAILKIQEERLGKMGKQIPIFKFDVADQNDCLNYFKE